MKTKRIILIIEDERSVIETLVQFFELKEYEVHTAEDGLEGLKCLEQLQWSVDLILTDLVMPNVSGLGVISVAKKRFPEIPILAITGAGPVPAEAATEFHADWVIEKPLNMHQMERIIEDLIWKSKSQMVLESGMHIH